MAALTGRALLSLERLVVVSSRAEKLAVVWSVDFAPGDTGEVVQRVTVDDPSLAPGCCALVQVAACVSRRLSRADARVHAAAELWRSGCC